MGKREYTPIKRVAMPQYRTSLQPRTYSLFDSHFSYGISSKLITRNVKFELQHIYIAGEILWI
jgi:hypothetical protein